MSNVITGNRQRVRSTISLVASLLLGLTFLASGLGKLFSTLPQQTEYIDLLIPAFFMTPTMALFIGYVLPWIELALGVFLLLGIWPRLLAVLCLPLTFAFMVNNSWMVSQGMDEFPHCALCFGKLEEILGALSPLQALCMDIGLLALALIIIFVHPYSFFSRPLWMTEFRKKNRGQQDG